uniref:Uncharacterized protein n=1 Tax=Arundo donax TaxID=35708 RepID=A0A0A9CXH9_ARUDO
MGGQRELVDPGSPGGVACPELPILPSATFRATAPTEQAGSGVGCSAAVTPFGSSYLALMQTMAHIGFMDHNSLMGYWSFNGQPGNSAEFSTSLPGSSADFEYRECDSESEDDYIVGDYQAMATIHEENASGFLSCEENTPESSPDVDSETHYSGDESDAELEDLSDHPNDQETTVGYSSADDVSGTRLWFRNQSLRSMMFT